MKNSAANAIERPVAQWNANGARHARCTPQERQRREHLVGARKRGARRLRAARRRARLASPRPSSARRTRSPAPYVRHTSMCATSSSTSRCRPSATLTLAHASASTPGARSTARRANGASTPERGPCERRAHARTSPIASGTSVRTARTPPESPSRTPISTSRSRTARRADSCPPAIGVPRARSRPRERLARPRLATFCANRDWSVAPTVAPTPFRSVAHDSDECQSRRIREDL